jgi:hypothetical protein
MLGRGRKRKDLFKRENKGECWVGEGRERSIQERE